LAETRTGSRRIQVRAHVVEQDGIEQFGRSGRLLANVNTPAELDDLEALLGHEV
jgi:hypothetical protein